MTKTRMITKLIVVLALAGCAAFLSAGPTSAAPTAPTSAAQEPPCDPDLYNCPPPPGTEFQLELTLSLDVGPQGLGVRAQVCGFSGPNVPFRVVFLDVLIIEGISGDGPNPPARCSASQTFSNAAAPAAAAETAEVAGAAVVLISAQQQNGFPLTFKVPNLALVTHQVCASAPGHNSDCDPFTIIGSGGSGTGTSLARTGITIGLLLAVALGLIVGGRAIVETARRRREGDDETSGDREHAGIS